MTGRKLDREHERMLHELVAGEASPKDVARVEAWLATSAEGRQRRIELEALFAALAAVPRVAPPAGLRDDVLAAISATVRTPAAAYRASRPALWLIPVAVAAVAVVIAFPSLRRVLPPAPVVDVSGTLAPSRTPTQATTRGTSQAPPQAAPTGRGLLALPGTDVAMAVANDARGTRASFEVTASGPVTVEFEAAPATLARTTFTGLAPGAISRDDAHGCITVALARASHFALEIRPALGSGGAVRVAVHSGDQVVEGILPQPAESR